MSPREIMNESEAEEIVHDQHDDRLPEIQSVSEEDIIIAQENRADNGTEKSNYDYAGIFPDWDLLPPQVEIRRVSHRQK